jgi:hypothetical protein
MDIHIIRGTWNNENGEGGECFNQGEQFKNRYFYPIARDQEGPRILGASASRWVVKGVRLCKLLQQRARGLGGENVHRKGVVEEKVPADS